MHQDGYNLDDLLVSVTQEIMVNGMDTLAVPETIKDWLAGKVLRALPKRLNQKLLSFLLDNRDMEGSLGFREREDGDIPEFTLLLYRSAKSKERKEREGKARNLDENDFDQIDHRKNVAISLGLAREENDEKSRTIFDENSLDKKGIRFFDDVIIDPTVKKESNKTTIKRKKDDDGFRVSKSLDFTDSEDSEYEIDRKPKRKKSSKTRKPSETLEPEPEPNSEDEIYDHYYKPKKAEDGTGCFCQCCGKKFRSGYETRRHQKAKHKEWWAQRPEERLGAHPIKKKRKDAEDQLDKYPEIMHNPETHTSRQNFTCMLCTKTSTTLQHAIRHLNAVHKKEKNCTCHVCGQSFSLSQSLKKHMFLHTGMPSVCVDCGKQFASEHKLREEHMKKHHPERYKDVRLAMDLEKMREDQENLMNLSGLKT